MGRELNPSRRKFLGGILGFAILTALGTGCDDEPKTDFEYTIGLYKEGKPFGNEDANEVAERIGITAGSFFKPGIAVLNRLSAYQNKRLYPIYPPAVHKYNDLIYGLAKEFKQPPNAIATLMTIESAGHAEAGSEAGALGLFQVVPDESKYPSNILEIKNPEKRKEAMYKPENNGRAGMRYLTEQCLPAARVYLGSLIPEIDPNHPIVWGRAMVGYNAGARSAYTPFEQLPEETKFYGDHVIRFFLTAEIADGLRSKGYKDVQIIQALSSLDIDARAFALGQWDERKRNSQGGYSYEEYMTVIDILSDQGLVPPANTRISQQELYTIGTDYVNYLNHPSYTLPASPGLRIWSSLSGHSLLSRAPENFDINKWKKLSS